MFGRRDRHHRGACASREAGERSVAIEHHDDHLGIGADRLRGSTDGAQAPPQIGLLVESRHHHGEPRHAPVIGAIDPPT